MPARRDAQPPGRQINRLWGNSPTQGPAQLATPAVDVTAQQEAELARGASEEQLNQLMTRADCMLWQAHVTRDDKGTYRWEWFVPRSELYRRLAGNDPDAKPIMPWGKLNVPEYGEIEARSSGNSA